MTNICSQNSDAGLNQEKLKISEIKSRKSNQISVLVHQKFNLIWPKFKKKFIPNVKKTHSCG
jgi:hypothetical protein